MFKKNQLHPQIATYSMTSVDLSRDPETGQFLADLSLSLYFLKLCCFQPIPATRLLFELFDSLQL